jgi:hypothetical protein
MEAGKIFCAIFIVFFQGFWWYNIAIEVGTSGGAHGRKEH